MAIDTHSKWQLHFTRKQKKGREHIALESIHYLVFRSLGKHLDYFGGVWVLLFFGGGGFFSFP